MKRLIILIINLLIISPVFASYVHTTSFSGPGGEYYERQVYSTPHYSHWGNSVTFGSGVVMDREYVIGQGYYPPCRAYINNYLMAGEAIHGYCHVVWRGQPIAVSYFEVLNPYGYWQWVDNTHNYYNNGVNVKYHKQNRNSGFSVKFSIDR